MNPSTDAAGSAVQFLQMSHSNPGRPTRLLSSPAEEQMRIRGRAGVQTLGLGSASIVQFTLMALKLVPRILGWLLPSWS